MMAVAEIMPRDVAVISHETIMRAARMMDELGVVRFPSALAGALSASFSDRDIIVCSPSCGQAPDATPVGGDDGGYPPRLRG
jgi:CBS domain-containing protein